MRIPEITNVFISRNQYKKGENNKSQNPKLDFLSYDTVSFGSRLNKIQLFNKFNDLDESAYPSIGLREYILSHLADAKNKKNPYELHKEYYSELLNCSTLDEAKALYPEFERVVDAATIDYSKSVSMDMIRRIASSKFEGLTIENASLDFLKKYYGEFLPLKYEQNYFGIDHATMKKLLKRLNMDMDPRYRNLIANQMRGMGSNNATNLVGGNHINWTDERKKEFGQRSKERWQDPEYQERMKRIWTPERRQQQSAIIKQRWDDEREKMIEGIQRAWDDPETKAHRVEIIRQSHSTPEYKIKASEAQKKRYQKQQTQETEGKKGGFEE